MITMPTSASLTIPASLGNPLVFATLMGENTGLIHCMEGGSFGVEHLFVGGTLVADVALRIVEQAPSEKESLLIPAIMLGEVLDSEEIDVEGAIRALHAVADGFARSVPTIYSSASRDSTPDFFGGVDRDELQGLLRHNVRRLRAIRSEGLMSLIEMAFGFNTASHELIARVHPHSDHFESSHFGRLLEKGSSDSVMSWIAHRLAVRNPNLVLEEQVPTLVGIAADKGNTEVLSAILKSGNRTILIPNIPLILAHAKEFSTLAEFMKEMKRTMPEVFPAPKRGFFRLFG